MYVIKSFIFIAASLFMSQITFFYVKSLAATAPVRKYISYEAIQEWRYAWIKYINPDIT